MAILLLAGCDRSPSPPRAVVIARIDLSTLTDTLDAGGTMPIRATLVGRDGSSVTGRSPKWSTSNAALLSTDSAGVVTALPPGPLSTTPVDVIASVDSVEARKTLLVVPLITSVAIRSPGVTLALGRSVRDSVTVLGATGFALNFPASSIQWRSSDSTILTVAANGLTTARKLGRATLTASVRAHRDSLTIDVVPGYDVRDIAPDVMTSVVGGTNVDGTALNDVGQVVGTSRINPILLLGFFWDDGRVSTLSECIPVAVNNAGQAACNLVVHRDYAYAAPAMWQNGIVTPLFLPDTGLGTVAGINESGMLAGTRNGPFTWRAGISTTIALSIVGSAAAINNFGDVAVVNTTYRQGTLWIHGREQSVGGVGGRYIGIAALNDSADAVGSAETLPGRGWQAILWLASTGYRATALGQLTTEAHDVNNARQVVGLGPAGGFLWENGRPTVLSAVVVDSTWTITDGRAINSRGQILARAKRGSTTTAVLLTPRRALAP